MRRTFSAIPRAGICKRMSTLNIYCNAHFPESAARILREGIGANRLILSQKPQESNLVAGGPDPLLAEADIALGQPDAASITLHPRLRWVHLTTAGYDRYDRPDVRAALHARGGALTTSSGVYDEPCAQHALSLIMAQARQLPAALKSGLTDRSWPIKELRGRSRLLGGQTVLILGFGSIARRLAQYLKPLGTKVIAVRRTVRGDEPVETFPETQVNELLQQADHVVNILPGGAATERYFTSARFALMKPSAVFYNIGRGSTVDQTALAEALASSRIAAAYLDVTTPEPLPPDHPLWAAPNCYITPHTAGGHDTEFNRLAQHFVANLKRWEQGEGLENKVV